MGYTHSRAHTLSSPSHPDTSRLPHLLLYLLFVSCSLLCLSSGSLQPCPIPPLIFVFLKAIVLLDHYEILRGTDCCPLILVRTERLRELASPLLSTCPEWHPIGITTPPKQCDLFVDGLSSPWLGLLYLEKEEMTSGSWCGGLSPNAFFLNTFPGSGWHLKLLVGARCVGDSAGCGHSVPPVPCNHCMILP